MPQQSPEPDELLRYIRENRERYTPEAMRAQLIAAGHALEDVDAAFRLVDDEQSVGVTLDLRGRAIAIMVAGYVGTWLVFALFSNPNYQSASGLNVILAAFLFVGGLVSLPFIRLSGSLKSAQPDRVAGALAVGLAIPLIILVGLAGLCIATTDPFGSGPDLF